jgi:hypothetical protein
MEGKYFLSSLLKVHNLLLCRTHYWIASLLAVEISWHVTDWVRFNSACWLISLRITAAKWRMGLSNYGLCMWQQSSVTRTVPHTHYFLILSISSFFITTFMSTLLNDDILMGTKVQSGVEPESL